MFSKNKTKPAEPTTTKPAASPVASKPVTPPMPTATPTPVKAKPSPSVLATDLFIKGDIETSGDIQVEGRIKGNINAHILTIGEGALIEGEVRADDVTVHGKVKGTLRGLKVRLTSSAEVVGDIIHKTISIESGANFEGTVTRHDDPISGTSTKVSPKAAKSE